MKPLPPLTTQPDHWRIVQGLLVAVFAFVLVRSLVTDWNHVPSGSMAPSIVPGDRILVNKLAFGLRLPFVDAPLMQWHTPQRSDIVVFFAPTSGLLMVKRVVGVPGDRVSWRNGVLRVNGIDAIYHAIATDPAALPMAAAATPVQAHSEDVLAHDRPILLEFDRTHRVAGDFFEVRVPEHHYLMLGDNRDNSIDYRTFGFVPGKALVGRVSHILFSLSPQNTDTLGWARWARWGTALD